MAGYLKALREGSCEQQQQKHEEKVGWKGKQSKNPYRQQRSRNWHSVGPEEHVSPAGGFFL
jgi:hypothetical protein